LAWLSVVPLHPDLSIEVVGETTSHAWSGTLSKVRSPHISFYDAAHLALAMRRGPPLAMLERLIDPKRYRSNRLRRRRTDAQNDVLRQRITVAQEHGRFKFTVEPRAT
jgi:hypothetical protein